ncbi:MAG: MucR family transcriptional regulator [Candidatus Aminicenantes bacterium]|nr:MucR family transcriptional regulator [Candidatus Aminicenantes bacterium]
MGKLLEMAASIVESQAMSSSLGTDEVVESLRRVFDVIRELNTVECGEQPETATVQAQPAQAEKVSPVESIRDDHVVCLECGRQLTQVTANHLKSHGLTPREYKKKWGFRLRDSLACRNLQRSRSEAAKKRGIPDNLKRYLEKRRKN